MRACLRDCHGTNSSEQPCVLTLNAMLRSLYPNFGQVTVMLLQPKESGIVRMRLINKASPKACLTERFVESTLRTSDKY